MTLRFYHAIIPIPEKCDGCMKCLRSCPTQALRVRENTPVIVEDFCIDCGACIAACPRKAIVPNVDRIRETSAYDVKVAVPSLVLYSQLGMRVSPREVHLALSKLGFDYIYDVADACGMVSLAVQEHLARTPKSDKPLISSMCPAVVRLIQVKYPSLVSHVIPFEPPRELTAREAKIKVAQSRTIDIRKVGAFYISPCPAKSISVLQPAEKERSFLDGFIAISDIYVRLLDAIREMKTEEVEAFSPENVVFGSGWERTGLMSRSLKVKSWIAVSGLDHVVKILDDIEAMRLDGIDFVEANACFEGCLGGCLTAENVYVARSKTLMLEEENNDRQSQGQSGQDRDWVRQLYDHGYFFMENELKPRTQEKSSDIPNAILAMKKRDELTSRLPGIDCCVCGSPTCAAFAEDVLKGETTFDQCPFPEAGKARNDQADPEERSTEQGSD